VRSQWQSVICFAGCANLAEIRKATFLVFGILNTYLMKDERWILGKIEKNATLDTFFPAGFSSAELPEWCTVKALTRLGTALLEPGRSMLGLEPRSPSILSLSRTQKSVLAVVVLSFSRGVAAPECFKPWHSLIIEVLPDIPQDALEFISCLLACDIQFRLDFFSKSSASVVVRSLATSFAIQVLPLNRSCHVVPIIQTFCSIQTSL